MNLHMGINKMIVVNKSLFDKLAEQYNLEKALGHKYIKRVPKKNGKGYIYYYSDGHGGLVAGKPPKNENQKKGGENTADFGVKIGDKVSFESKSKTLEGIVRGGDKDSIIIDGIGEGKGIRYTVHGNQVKEKTGNADGTFRLKSSARSITRNSLQTLSQQMMKTALNTFLILSV